MSATPKGKFPKTSHLLRHADFQRVYKQGRRHFSGNMTVFYLRKPQTPPAEAEAVAGANATGAARIGFTVPKALGKAVDRNRIRRRMREAVRHHLDLLGDTSTVDVVFNPKRSVLTLEFATLSTEVARALDVVRKNITRGGAEPRPSSGQPQEQRTQ